MALPTPGLILKKESSMSFRFTRSGIYLCGILLLALLSLPALAGDKSKDDKKDSGKQTLTGVVSDSMCGAHHMMEGSPTDCTRACISKGSKYALVVGDKVYTLDTQDKAALEELNKHAGEKAKVTGTVSGDTIQVSSVAGS
jgi:hypothetical protein